MDDNSVIPFIFIGILILGLPLAIVIGYFARTWLANQFMGLLVPDDNDYRVEPQYSIAKARIAAGRFEDAIQEYRNAMSLYPNDLNVHFHIAEVYVNHLHEPLDALQELDFGQRRTRDPERKADFVSRKAEIHLLNRRDPGNAALEIENFLAQHPKAKASILLNEKLKQIRETLEG
jgi:hypothetical protein